VRVQQSIPHIEHAQALDWRLGTVLEGGVGLIVGAILAVALGWQLGLIVVAVSPLLVFGQIVEFKVRSDDARDDIKLMEEAGKVSYTTPFNLSAHILNRHLMTRSATCEQYKV
jgi:hypothetical protein